jgi:hypothetical protein
MLATFLVSGLRVFGSASGAKKTPERSTRKKSFFGLKIKRAGISFFGDRAKQQLV